MSKTLKAIVTTSAVTVVIFAVYLVWQFSPTNVQARRNAEYTRLYDSAMTKYDASGNKVQMVVELSKAIELNPNRWEGYLSRAAIRYQLDDRKGALQDYREAEKIVGKISKTSQLYSAIAKEISELEKRNP